MLAFVARRVVQSVPVVFVVSVLVFLALHFVPGDPLLASQGTQLALSAEQLAGLRHELGFDQPLVVQYLRWIAGAVRGDLGISYYDQQSVAHLVALRLPATLQLTATALGVAFLCAVPIGVLSAVKPNSWVDYIGTTLVTFGMAVPAFWFGIMLILLFSVTLRWLPPVGYAPLLRNPAQNLQHVVLPALTLGVIIAAPTMRFLRSSMLEVIGQNFVQTARAKGLGERPIIVRHVLRNALIPAVTIVGLQLGNLLGGAVVIEWVFGWPGLGQLTIDAIKMRNYSVVQSTVLMLATGFVLVNLFVDLLYGALDPRIRYSDEA
jgi:peptide/nickel transport system permease protein